MKKIMESAEDYLETIFTLKNATGFVRSVDIANELGYSKPSVSVAMKRLRESGHIYVSDGGGIELTQSGLAIAKSIYERHTTLTKVLIMLGVREETAVEDACRIEHYISQETFEAIKQHLKEHEEG